MQRNIFALWAATATLPAFGEPAAAAPAVGVTGMLQVLLGLGAVLVAIFVAAWLARRLYRGPMLTGGQLRVLGGVSMGSRERVVLLQVGEKQLLVGVAPGRVQTLHVLDEPLQAAVLPAGPGGQFATQLGQALRRARPTE